MKIALFGATGKTGMEVLKQLLQKGYDINAFVRDTSKLPLTDVKLKAFVGDVNNSNSFKDILVGVDVVVITLGGEVTEGIKNIINSMKANGVKKIVLMSSYPMSGSVEGMNYLKSAGMDDAKIGGMMPMIQGKIEEEAVVTASGLNWTIVRPTFLKDEPKTGVYKSVENAEFTVKDGINRADVADFILNVLETNDWDKKIANISS